MLSYCLSMQGFLKMANINVAKLVSFISQQAAEHYINPTGEDRSGERPAIESTEPYTEVQLRLDASRYNADTAVAYAREWTEAGKKLWNPDFHREDSDCTNFASQVLYAGGIPQVSGERKSSDAWFYEYGLIARPNSGIGLLVK